MSLKQKAEFLVKIANAAGYNTNTITLNDGQVCVAVLLLNDNSQMFLSNCLKAANMECEGQCPFTFREFVMDLADVLQCSYTSDIGDNTYLYLCFAPEVN